MRGDEAEADLESLPLMRQELQYQLQDFSLQEVFNCDELHFSKYLTI